MTAEELLNVTLNIFKSYRDGTKILEQLLKQEIIHESCERRDILNLYDFDFGLVEKVVENNNSKEFYLDAADTTPYKMVFIFEEKWYLKAVLFLCQGCFGDDAECNVCDGSGWGVL